MGNTPLRGRTTPIPDESRTATHAFRWVKMANRFWLLFGVLCLLVAGLFSHVAAQDRLATDSSPRDLQNSVQPKGPQQFRNHDCPSSASSGPLRFAVISLCNRRVADAVHSLAFGLRVNDRGLAVVDVIDYITAADADAVPDVFITDPMVGSYGCEVVPHGPDDGVVSARPTTSERTVIGRRQVTLADLFRSICQPPPVPGLRGPTESEREQRIATSVLNMFEGIATELARLTDEDERLAAIFDRPRVTPQVPNPNLGLVDEPRQLSAAALELADAARLFLIRIGETGRLTAPVQREARDSATPLATTEPSNPTVLQRAQMLRRRLTAVSTDTLGSGQ